MQYDSSPWQNDLFDLRRTKTVYEQVTFVTSLESSCRMTSQANSWLALKLEVENVLYDVQEHMSPE